MQIKTLTFEVHNAFADGLYKKNATPERLAKVACPELIDQCISRFIAGRDVVDIRINHYTSCRHNNGGDDTVKAVYTIIYK